MTTARINNQITALELRVIGEDGENLGILSRDKALEVARERGVDLIEIAPLAKPPVARLMSYDKYRYQREKEAKKERLAQKGSGLKQVQISVRAAENDLRIKVNQAEKFLSEGHQVEIKMRLRGREKRNKEWALEKMESFRKMIAVEYNVLSEPKFGGFGVNMQIGKK